MAATLPVRRSCHAIVEQRRNVRLTGVVAFFWVQSATFRIADAEQVMLAVVAPAQRNGFQSGAGQSRFQTGPATLAAPCRRRATRNQEHCP